MKKSKLYAPIIERIFKQYHQPGATEVAFERKDIQRVAKKLRITLPENKGDVVYSFRFRRDLPDYIRSKAPEGRAWVIRLVGRSRYCFALVPDRPITPNEMLAEIKVPDATPGVIEMYALTDEQALLAKLRYNRLIDVFTGVTCYSLQSHLRTSVPSMGQVETDEIYVGIDRRGVHYVFPIQAKGGKDRLSIVQIEQDFALCAAKFPALICRPIAAQFVHKDLIALFDFVKGDEDVAVSSEKHYRLVPPEQLSPEELRGYQTSSL